MRLLLGLPLPRELQNALQRAWNGVEHQPTKDQTTKPSSWFLTVAFLDEVQNEHIPKLHELIEMALKHPPKGMLYIDGFESFPARNPTRIVAHVTPENPMQWGMFVEGVRDLASLIAPRVDRKPWKPHISLIRKEKGFTLTHWSETIETIAWEPIEMASIASTPTPSGSQYEYLHVFPLNV